MQLNGLLNLCLYLFQSLAGSHTTGKIGNIGRIISFGFFDHYRITHGKAPITFSDLLASGYFPHRANFRRRQFSAFLEKMLNHISDGIA